MSAISNIVFADAWFYKKNFVDQIIQAKMNLISRVRDDADQLYPFRSEYPGGKGWPKKYEGKIIHSNIRKDYFNMVEQNDGATIYCAEVYSKSIKRIIKLVYVIDKNEKERKPINSTFVQTCHWMLWKS